MRQGEASSSRMGSTKVEPKSKAVSVKHVAEMGAHQVRMTNQKPKPGLYEGRGLEAPKAKSMVHNGGSQGKY